MINDLVRGQNELNFKPLLKFLFFTVLLCFILHFIVYRFLPLTVSSCVLFYQFLFRTFWSVFEKVIMKWNSPEYKLSLHSSSVIYYHLTRSLKAELFVFSHTVLLSISSTLSVSPLQPVVWTWTWRRVSPRLRRSRLLTLAPLRTPPCLPLCLPHCLPAFLITRRQTSWACRVSPGTTPTPCPPWPPPAPGPTPPRCRSCRASASSSRRNWGRDSLEKWGMASEMCVCGCLGWWKGDCAVTMFAFLRGKVHLCEIESPQDLPNLEFPFNVRKGRPLLVAVKILRPDASKNARCVTFLCGSQVFFLLSQLISSFNVFIQLQHWTSGTSECI